MFKKKASLLLILLISFYSFSSENLLLTLKQNIKELEQRYNSLKKQEKSVNDTIELISRKIEILKEKKKMLNLKKREVEKAISKLNSEIKKIDKKIENTKRYLKKRIKELYKRGDYTILESILSPEKEETYIYQLNTLAYLSQKDKNALKQLHRLRKEKGVRVKKLEQEKEKLDHTIKQIKKNRKDLRITLIYQKKLFRSLKRKKGKYISLLKERNRLMKLLIESLSKKQTPQNPSAIPMVKFKGLLSLPTKGRIIERFGTYRIGRYKARVKNNGITLKVKKGRRVKAFYDGVVVYADWYKSYGKLVIIDHGFGYYTFYAHLDKIFVKINQIVAKGDIIGIAGNTASLKGNILHFEIWHNKKPLNPLKWIKR